MLSKEEVRKARLRSLDAQNGSSINFLSTIDFTNNTNLKIDASVVNLINKVMYKGGGANQEDMIRWYEEGFLFCSNPKFGLKQSNGGPCGVLAVVQAEIIKDLLFNDENNLKCKELPNPSEVDVEYLLTRALSLILQRAADSEIIQIVINNNNNNNNSNNQNVDNIEYNVHKFQSKDEVEKWIFENLKLFQSPFGCIIFLMSLILSRLFFYYNIIKSNDYYHLQQININ
jgi:hypothetical protein